MDRSSTGWTSATTSCSALQSRSIRTKVEIQQLFWEHCQINCTKIFSLPRLTSGAPKATELRDTGLIVDSRASCSPKNVTDELLVDFYVEDRGLGREGFLQSLNSLPRPICTAPSTKSSILKAVYSLLMSASAGASSISSHFWGGPIARRMTTTRLGCREISPVLKVSIQLV